MNDFVLFCEKLKELFADPNDRATAERSIICLISTQEGIR
jgi:hypothetical protein